MKVTFENHLYDVDNLDGIIRITNRMDRMEMSVLSRQFALQFVLPEYTDITAEISLEASLQDLATEILELQQGVPACSLYLRFYMQIMDAQIQCKHIDQVLRNIWLPTSTWRQTISYVYGQDPIQYTNVIEVTFNRRITEDQMQDIPILIEHMIMTLTDLQNV
ncbi:hypothetical protein ACH8E3_10815 [Paenibacillus sp. CMAA1364]